MARKLPIVQRDIRWITLGTLLGGIAMWLLAGLWHSVIMAAFYSNEAGADHEGTGIILLAYLILGFLMAYLFPLVVRGDRPVAQGLKFGAIVGVLWVFPHELAMAGAHGESLLYVLKNGAWHVVEQGFGGLLMGRLYARMVVGRTPSSSRK